MVAWKLAWDISSCWRCTVTTELNFWKWEREEGDQAPDLPALLIDGELDDMEIDESQESNASTLNLGRGAHYRACDVVLFYTHLRSDFVIVPGHHWLGFSEPSDEEPKLPITLIEVKRNVSCQLDEESRWKDLGDQLEKAQKQLGSQAGFMFGNRLYERLPYIVAIAMAAEAWCYAVFNRADKPNKFDSTEEWVLPESEWSETFQLGTVESRDGLVSVQHRVEALLQDMGFDVV